MRQSIVWVVLLVFTIAIGHVLITGHVLAMTEKRLDPQTGLVIDRGFEIVEERCSVCHSARLITTVRLSRVQWLDYLRMKQEIKEGELGQLESEMLDYLSKHYSMPEATPLAR